METIALSKSGRPGGYGVALTCSEQVVHIPWYTRHPMSHRNGQGPMSLDDAAARLLAIVKEHVGRLPADEGRAKLRAFDRALAKAVARPSRKRAAKSPRSAGRSRSTRQRAAR